LTSKTILLIEDNPSDIALTRRALERARIANQLVVAEDGQEALDYVFGAGAFRNRDPADIPMLTLMDMKLPKVSTLDVLRRVRSDARTRRMPVVILTTSKSEEDVLRAYDLHANCYIAKPVDFNRFMDVVRSIENFWLTVVRLPEDN